jgi:ribonuclease-3|tara:strand:+ start:6458 stop:7171 length:714 start_codon:yes stop_codon:yes gene_type:complete
MLIDRATIENLVGTKISNIALYQKAFTHKSALKENENLSGSFETLEFIGDSVLGFVITKFLYDKFEERQEGFLTKARTKLVRGETLASIASKLELYKWIQMDEKGMRNEWNHNPKILEDAFEALVGAIYMDLGLLHTKEFILRIYNDPQFVNLDSIMVDDNFKDHLMRYCQSNGLQLPVYSIVRHDSGVFYIAVFVDNVCVGQGYAKNKKLGEQYAAKSFFYPPVVPTSLNSLGVHY